MLTATWEPAWSAGGLGDPAVHVRLDEPHAARAQLAAWLGPGVVAREVPDGRGLLRLGPELDLATFALLLARAGLEVEELVSGSALRASQPGRS